MRKFRLLKADEIKVRVGGRGTLVLYKNAKCDMDILDETVGEMNWQRGHYRVGDSLCCEVGIWDDQKACWVNKSDVGSESRQEKEKGEASDSFKRACMNWGIGLELKTAPEIKVTADKDDKFHVAKITYVNEAIDGLVIVNQDNKIVFTQMPKEQKNE